MKHTKNDFDKKDFQNFSKYLYEQSDSPNTDTSLATKKEIQKVYLLMKQYKQYEKQNKKNNTNPPPKKKKMPKQNLINGKHLQLDKTNTSK